MWCLDHYVPLIQHADGAYPWILVPYERMVTQGREELRRVTNALDVQMTPEMRDQLDEPSSSIKDQLHQDAQRQLSSGAAACLTGRSTTCCGLSTTWDCPQSTRTTWNRTTIT
jgi:hypothetical protein